MKNWIRLAVLLGFVTAVQTVYATPSLKLRFPIADSDRRLISGLPVMGVDHDPQTGGPKTQCENHHGNGWPFCYNGHGGTDYVLIGGFATMDRGSARIVAAAAGKVIEAVDGNYDRCAVELGGSFEISCHGKKKAANYVTIEHSDGTRTRYLHMKRGSVAVKKGERVFCGQVLGLVGSSGNSSMPHLHFDVYETNGKRVDPYSGPNSQKYSYWRKEYMADGLPSSGCSDQVSRPPVLTPCQWKTVTSAAQCGMEQVESALACGTQMIQDAAECGTQTVTNAAQCGTQSVTNAAQCGSELITSATQCGTELITDAFKCAMNGFGLVGSCEVAKKCSVPKTCRVPKSCEIAKSCQVALECEVPSTCQVSSCGSQFGIRSYDFNRKN